jgi:hypothetical protein
MAFSGQVETIKASSLVLGAKLPYFLCQNGIKGCNTFRLFSSISIARKVTINWLLVAGLSSQKPRTEIVPN